MFIGFRTREQRPTKRSNFAFRSEGFAANDIPFPVFKLLVKVVLKENLCNKPPSLLSCDGCRNLLLWTTLKTGRKI